MTARTTKNDTLWRPDNHPPHKWPIGQPASWREGHGCPVVRCQGEGPGREGDADA